MHCTVYGVAKVGHDLAPKQQHLGHTQKMGKDASVGGQWNPKKFSLSSFEFKVLLRYCSRNSGSSQLDMGNWNLKGGLNCKSPSYGDRSLQTGQDGMAWPRATPGTNQEIG